MKIAVLTSICGNIEELGNPSVVHESVQYFAFVERKVKHATAWTQMDPYHFSLDQKYAQRRNAKIYKILPELFIPNFDYYFWLDASHDLIAEPETVVEKYLSAEQPFAVFQHRERDCLYEEAVEIKKLGYDHNILIDQQLEFYKLNRYPRNNGLYELSTFIKKRTHQSTLASLMWWENICRFSSRDQLSFPFVLWKCGITPSVLPGYANGLNSNGEIGNNDIMPQTRIHRSSGAL